MGMVRSFENAVQETSSQTQAKLVYTPGQILDAKDLIQWRPPVEAIPGLFRVEWQAANDRINAAQKSFAGAQRAVDDISLTQVFTQDAIAEAQTSADSAQQRLGQAMSTRDAMNLRVTHLTQSLASQQVDRSVMMAQVTTAHKTLSALNVSINQKTMERTQLEPTLRATKVQLQQEATRITNVERQIQSLKVNPKAGSDVERKRLEAMLTPLKLQRDSLATKLAPLTRLESALAADRKKLVDVRSILTTAQAKVQRFNQGITTIATDLAAARTQFQQAGADLLQAQAAADSANASLAAKKAEMQESITRLAQLTAGLPMFQAAVNRGNAAFVGLATTIAEWTVAQDLNAKKSAMQKQQMFSGFPLAVNRAPGITAVLPTPDLTCLRQFDMDWQGNRLVIVTAQTTARIDTQSGSVLWSKELSQPELAFSPDHSKIAIPSGTNILIVSADSGEQLDVITTNGPIRGLVWRNAELLVSNRMHFGGDRYDDTWFSVDLQTRSLSLAGAPIDPVRSFDAASVVFDPSPAHFTFTLNAFGTLATYDAKREQVARSRWFDLDPNGPTPALAISADGRRLLAYGQGLATLFSVNADGSVSKSRQFIIPRDASSPSFEPDGNRILMLLGSPGDGGLAVLDLAKASDNGPYLGPNPSNLSSVSAITPLLKAAGSVLTSDGFVSVAIKNADVVFTSKGAASPYDGRQITGQPTTLLTQGSILLVGTLDGRILTFAISPRGTPLLVSEWRVTGEITRLGLAQDGSAVHIECRLNGQASYWAMPTNDGFRSLLNREITKVELVEPIFALTREGNYNILRSSDVPAGGLTLQVGYRAFPTVEYGSITIPAGNSEIAFLVDERQPMAEVLIQTKDGLRLDTGLRVNGAGVSGTFLPLVELTWQRQQLATSMQITRQYQISAIEYPEGTPQLFADQILGRLPELLNVKNHSDYLHRYHQDLFGPAGTDRRDIAWQLALQKTGGVVTKDTGGEQQNFLNVQADVSLATSREFGDAYTAYEKIVFNAFDTVLGNHLGIPTNVRAAVTDPWNALVKRYGPNLRGVDNVFKSPSEMMSLIESKFNNLYAFVWQYARNLKQLANHEAALRDAGWQLDDRGNWLSPGEASSTVGEARLSPDILATVSPRGIIRVSSPLPFADLVRREEAAIANARKNPTAAWAKDILAKATTPISSQSQAALVLAAARLPTNSNAGPWVNYTGSEFHVGASINAVDLNRVGFANSDQGACITPAAAGKVVEIVNTTSESRVTIEHQTAVAGTTITWYSIYDHLAINPTLATNQSVGLATGLGTVDTIGTKSSHLHFEIRIGSAIAASTSLVAWLAVKGVATKADPARTGRNTGGVLIPIDSAIQNIDNTRIGSTNLTPSWTFDVSKPTFVNIWLEDNLNGWLHLDGTSQDGQPVHFSSTHKVTGAAGNKVGQSISTVIPVGRYNITVQAAASLFSIYGDRSETLSATLRVSVDQAFSNGREGRISREGISKVLPVRLSVAEYSGYDRKEATNELDPSKPVWVVVHGMWSSEKAGNIDVAARELTMSGMQVVMLDWEKAAVPQVITDDAAWTPAVGQWAALQLLSLGFAPEKINIVGHSHGTYVAFEFATEVMKGADGRQINALVALDPAGNFSPVSGYDATKIDFASVSRTSLALEGSFGAGSDALAATADLTFRVLSSSWSILSGSLSITTQHALPVSAFARLLALGRDASNNLPTQLQLPYIMQSEDYCEELLQEGTFFGRYEGTIDLYTPVWDEQQQYFIADPEVIRYRGKMDNVDAIRTFLRPNTITTP